MFACTVSFVQLKHLQGLNLHLLIYEQQKVGNCRNSSNINIFLHTRFYLFLFFFNMVIVITLWFCSVKKDV